MPILNSETAKATTWTFANLFSFLKKHWYFILFILAILPGMIETFKLTLQTHNWSYPVVHFVLSIVNSDSLLNTLINGLRTSPETIIGMIKPTFGLWNQIVYDWHLFLVFWKIAGYVVLIFFPFKTVYYFMQQGNNSKPGRNKIWTLVTVLVLVFVVNLILVIVALAGDTTYITIPSGDVFSKTWFIITQTLPFHGTVNLFGYLTGLW